MSDFNNYDISTIIQFVFDNKSLVLVLSFFILLAMISILIFVVIITHDSSQSNRQKKQFLTKKQKLYHEDIMHYLYNDLKSKGYSHQQSIERVNFAGHYCHPTKSNTFLPQRVYRFVMSQDFNKNQVFRNISYYD